jgi:hypothetical protein
MTCPQCGYEMREREGHFPDCEDCGHIEYDAEALALGAEVMQEFLRASAECWPNPVPAYKEYQAGKRGGE